MNTISMKKYHQIEILAQLEEQKSQQKKNLQEESTREHIF